MTSARLSEERGGRTATAKGDATRERIVAAAERLFAERGFAGTSMPLLAKACGISAGAIYRHFDSKEALFFEVVRRAVESARSSGADEVGGAARSIAEVVATYTLRRVKLLRQMAVEMHYAASKDDKVRRLLRQSVDREIGVIAAALTEAQRVGEMDSSLDPGLMAAAVMTFIMGLMHMETLTPRLVGDVVWHDFVRDRVASMMRGG